MSSIIVRGAREHNLKNVTVEIPRDQLTVITGLSGSGKSSLAFDTIYAEGQRRYVESLSAYVACSGAPGEHAAAFLLCDCCGRTEEIAAPVDEALRGLAAQVGYVIQTVAIEAHGRCAACREPTQE